jgi:hypothetical protein
MLGKYVHVYVSFQAVEVVPLRQHGPVSEAELYIGSKIGLMLNLLVVQ